MEACFRHRIENKMIIRTLSHNSDFVLVIVNCEFTSQNCLSQKKKVAIILQNVLFCGKNGLP